MKYYLLLIALLFICTDSFSQGFPQGFALASAITNGQIIKAQQMAKGTKHQKLEGGQRKFTVVMS